MTFDLQPSDLSPDQFFWSWFFELFGWDGTINADGDDE